MTVVPSDVSVVIPTRDRPDRLAACLAAVAALDPGPGEVIVVDSASTSLEATAPATGVATAVVRCDRPGASIARNAGWQAASGAVVAFVDDDVRVVDEWLAELCRPFGDEDVVLVTGAVVAGESIGDGGDGRPVAVTDDVAAGRFDRSALGNVGASANLAVRRAALVAVGGFDELLGAGAPFRAAEDLDLFDRLLRHGCGWHSPGAVGRHDQWRSRRELFRLEGAYGFGYGVRLSKLLRDDRPRARALARYEALRLIRDVARDLRNRYAFGVLSRSYWAAALLVGAVRGGVARVREGHLERP